MFILKQVYLQFIYEHQGKMKTVNMMCYMWITELK